MSADTHRSLAARSSIRSAKRRHPRFRESVGGTVMPEAPVHSCAAPNVSSGNAAGITCSGRSSSGGQSLSTARGASVLEMSKTKLHQSAERMHMHVECAAV
jgi:hypothetical protein